MRTNPIPGLDGYAADEDGCIWKTAGRQRLTFKPHPLRAVVGAHGYLTVRVFVGSKGITKTVHSLVARAFHGERPAGFEVCHIDGDRINNRPSNLRWGTTKENALDRARHRTLVVPKGRGDVRADVSPDAVAALRASGLSINKIAQRLGVSWGVVKKRLTK